MIRNYFFNPNYLLEEKNINNLERINKYEDEINKLGGKLSDLPRTKGFGKHTMIEFDNGYGLSFIEGGRSYGLEAAVIKLTDKHPYWELCYDTPITDDVIGYLEEEEILPLIQLVAGL